MEIGQKHLEFKSHCEKLIGKKIVSVGYAEIDYGKLENRPSEPYYHTHYENIHTIDFSIFMHTDQNEKLEFHWDSKFFQYDIGLKINGKSDFSGCKHWNLTDHEIWSNILNLEIKDVKLGWEKVNTEESNGFKETIYPQDITLTFENGKNIFISAAQFLNQNDKEAFGMSDNLLITDNEELARMTKIIE